MTNARLRDRREPGWYRIDNEFLRNGYGKHLGPYGIAVYDALALHVNKEEACFPSLDTIAEMTGMSRPTVIKQLETLETLNIVSVERTNGRANCYTLTHKHDWKPVKPLNRPKKKPVNRVNSGVNGVNTNKTHVTRKDNDDSSESSPAPKRTRKKSKLDVLKSDLTTHFSEISGISKPKCSTPGDRSAAGRLWWSPLVRIADLVDRDPDRAKNLIEWAITHADNQKNKLTISTPLSIEKLCIAEQARRLRQNGHTKQPSGYIEQAPAPEEGGQPFLVEYPRDHIETGRVPKEAH